MIRTIALKILGLEKLAAMQAGIVSALPEIQRALIAIEAFMRNQNTNNEQLLHGIEVNSDSIMAIWKQIANMKTKIEDLETMRIMQ